MESISIIGIIIVLMILYSISIHLNLKDKKKENECTELNEDLMNEYTKHKKFLENQISLYKSSIDRKEHHTI